MKRNDTRQDERYNQNTEKKNTERNGKKKQNNLFSGVYHAKHDIEKFIYYMYVSKLFKTEEQE